MACHTPPLKKAKEIRGNAITQPQSHPFKNVEFRDGKGLKLDDGISPCFFACFEGWSLTGHPKYVIYIFWRNFASFYELFCVHEMCC